MTTYTPNDITLALKTFDKLIEKSKVGLGVREVERDIYYLKGSGQQTVCILVSTHGNEPAGIAILNHKLQSLLLTKHAISNSVYFIVANRAALLANERFIDEDLNRLYGFNEKALNHEQHRIKIIRPFLDQCDASLDIHQTVEPTNRPFFLFPSTKQNKAFASYLNKALSAVTHPLQDVVTTSTSYMASLGKAGLTIEVGSDGVSGPQIKLGTLLVEKLLSWSKEDPTEVNKYYEIIHHEKTHLTGELKWKKELTNFAYVRRGNYLGTLTGQAIYAANSGFILLYPSAMFKNNKQPGGLYALIKEVTQ